MDIIVTGRHISVTEPIKDYARKKIENIGIDFPRIIEAHVILEVEKFRHIAEVILICNAHINIEAREVSEDLYASIDKVVDKVARQMRKHKTKLQNHRPRHAKPIELDSHIYPADDSEDDEAKPRGHAVRAEKLAVKPMYVDEAVLQMDVSDRQFLVFLNADTEKVNVMYRHKNGDFGLIVPSA